MKKSVVDRLIGAALLGVASVSIFVVLLIFLFLFKEALPFLWDPGIDKLLNERWVPVSFKAQSFGIYPLLTGSLLVTAMAIAIALPIGLAAAVYISEIAKPWERETLKSTVELLSAIPSVVMGFFGLMVLAPVIKSIFGLSTGLTALTGACILAFMAVPTIVTLSEEAIRSVPGSYRQGSLALGATPLQTVFRVTMPAALPGIMAAVMLGIGRVIGETMAVLMLTGNSTIVSLSPFDSVRTMTATIAAEMGEVPFGSVHYRALFCIGVILLLVTFFLNFVAQYKLRGMGERK